MKFRKLLTEITGCADSRVIKAYICCARTKIFNPKGSKFPILKERFLFLAVSMILPFFIRPFLKRSKTNDYMLIEGSGNNESIKIFRFFVIQNSGIDANSYHWKEGVFLHSFDDLKLFMATWLSLISLGLRLFFIKANLPIKPLLKFHIYLLQVRIFRPKKVFIVDYTQEEHYLLTVILPKLTRVVYIPSNSRLLEYMRYGYFKDVCIILTSPPQLDELKYYIDRGGVKLANSKVENWSYLFSARSSKFSKDVVYDLGFFSSGEWARSKGWFRTYDIHKIRENLKEGNEYWKLAKDVLGFLINYAKRHNLRLNIFLHPFEKDLIRKFGFYPPFVDYVDDKNIFICHDDRTSSSNFFEAKVGVITTSSILYDRLKFDLETYFYSPKQEGLSGIKPPYYYKKLLPSFSNFAFENLKELDEKLNRSFSINTD